MVKTFKDYLVPIIWFVLIIILLFSFFGGDNTPTEVASEENRVWINISLNGEWSEAYVMYPGGNKEEISNVASLYKGEKVVVKSGVASIEIPEVGNVELNKIGELKFDEDGWLSLYSSDLWVNLKASQKVNMRYGSVFAKENSVFSITQNEVWSTVYMLKWVADVTNLSWRSVVLGKWQKITISRSDAASEDIDLSILRNDLDDYFKSSEWYIRNNGDFFLNSEESTWTWSTDEELTSSGSISVSNQILSVSSPSDESTSDTDKITITWSFSWDDINSVTVNGTKASMDFENNSFEIKDFALPGKENNLVFKVYDGAGSLMDKSVRTVYYGWAASTAGKFQVENFSLDASKFTFIKPTANPYTTTTDLVTIQWYVPPWVVNRITVNGYQLNSLVPYWSYWRYHANSDFGNLKEGLNVYKVIYYWKENEVLHSNAFTIIKKAPVEPEEEKVVSDEATVDA